MSDHKTEKDPESETKLTGENRKTESKGDSWNPIKKEFQRKGVVTVSTASQGSSNMMSKTQTLDWSSNSNQSTEQKCFPV